MQFNKSYVNNNNLYLYLNNQNIRRPNLYSENTNTQYSNNNQLSLSYINNTELYLNNNESYLNNRHFDYLNNSQYINTENANIQNINTNTHYLNSEKHHWKGPYMTLYKNCNNNFEKINKQNSNNFLPTINNSCDTSFKCHMFSIITNTYCNISFKDQLDLVEHQMHELFHHRHCAHYLTNINNYELLYSKHLKENLMETGSGCLWNYLYEFEEEFNKLIYYNIPNFEHIENDKYRTKPHVVDISMKRDLIALRTRPNGGIFKTTIGKSHLLLAQRSIDQVFHGMHWTLLQERLGPYFAGLYYYVSEIMFCEDKLKKQFEEMKQQQKLLDQTTKKLQAERQQLQLENEHLLEDIKQQKQLLQELKEKQDNAKPVKITLSLLNPNVKNE
jgi:hypothetical protein